jgi:YD repeat-containing protein
MGTTFSEATPFGPGAKVNISLTVQGHRVRLASYRVTQVGSCTTFASLNKLTYSSNPSESQVGYLEFDPRLAIQETEHRDPRGFVTQIKFNKNSRRIEIFTRTVQSAAMISTIKFSFTNSGAKTWQHLRH